MNNSCTRLFRVSECLKRISYIVICIVLINVPLTSIAENNLPDISGPAGAKLSVSKEIELGQILISQIRGYLPISNDPELSLYIHSLGTRITSAGVNTNFAFNFLYVLNSSVNAFALPGGIVAINSGLLILKLESMV